MRDATGTGGPQGEGEGGGRRAGAGGRAECIHFMVFVQGSLWCFARLSSGLRGVVYRVACNICWCCIAIFPDLSSVASLPAPLPVQLSCLAVLASLRASLLLFFSCALSLLARAQHIDLAGAAGRPGQTRPCRAAAQRSTHRSTHAAVRGTPGAVAVKRASKAGGRAGAAGRRASRRRGASRRLQAPRHVRPVDHLPDLLQVVGPQVLVLQVLHRHTGGGGARGLIRKGPDTRAPAPPAAALPRHAPAGRQPLHPPQRSEAPAPPLTPRSTTPYTPLAPPIALPPSTPLLFPLDPPPLFIRVRSRRRAPRRPPPAEAPAPWWAAAGPGWRWWPPPACPWPCSAPATPTPTPAPPPPPPQRWR